MKSIVIASVAALASATTQLEFEFMQFMSKHNKSYESLEEYEMRKALFEVKDAFIKEHNMRGHKYTVAHNKFSDYTQAEMDALMGDLPDYENMYEVSDAVGDASYAPIDWISAGAVNPIQDQGQCGSCWAFSATASMEGAVQIKYGNLLKFSEQLLVSCDTNDSGCSGGNANYGFVYYQNHGPMSEASYPYTAKDGTCKYNSASAYSYRTNGSSAYVKVAYDDMTAMYNALAMQPLTVRIYASTYSFQTYHSGIYDDLACPTSHNHATNIVGYGTQTDSYGVSTDYWVMRNSWGTGWGEQGYMKMEVQATGPGICGVQNWPSYPVLA